MNTPHEVDSGDEALDLGFLAYIHNAEISAEAALRTWFDKTKTPRVSSETTRVFLTIASDRVLAREAVETVAKAALDGADTSKAIKQWIEQLLALEDKGEPNEMRINIGSLWRVNWKRIASALSPKGEV